MLNDSDWLSWKSSNETIAFVNLLNEYVENLKDALSDGSHIQEKSVEKISLDYTYTLGQIDGLREAIEAIKDISSVMDEEDKLQQ